MHYIFKVVCRNNQNRTIDGQRLPYPCQQFFDRPWQRDRSDTDKQIRRSVSEAKFNLIESIKVMLLDRELENVLFKV